MARLALLLLSALALRAQSAPVGGSERLGAKGLGSSSTISPSQTKLSSIRRLRDQMLKWYCSQPGNNALSPCKLMNLRAISDPAQRKEKLSAYGQMMKSKTKEERQADMKSASDVYTSMYLAYCSQVWSIRAPAKSCTLLVPCRGLPSLH